MMDSSAAVAPTYKRRTYLVDRTFQLKYTGILMVVGAAITALFGTMMYQAHVAATEMMGLPDTFKQVVTKSYDDRLLYMVGGIALVMTLSLALFGVLVTHRVAGPLYIMARYVRQLGEGQWPVIRPLRKNDELKQFFTGFQESVELMRSRDAGDLATVQAALSQLEKFCAASPQAAQELGSALVTLKALRDRKEHALSPKAGSGGAA
jgi:hypothetical protein